MEEFPLPSAVDAKLLVYQNAALRKQLESRRSETERLRQEISEYKQRVRLAELLALVALQQGTPEISLEEISDSLNSLMSDDSPADLHNAVAEIFRLSSTEPVSQARGQQLQSEISTLRTELELSVLEIQRLSLLRASAAISVLQSSPEPAAAQLQQQDAAGNPEISAAELEALRTQVTESHTHIASLKSEISWRRAEGYESLLGCLEAVHADRNSWRAKFAAVEEELYVFRRETSESLVNLSAEFSETVGNFSREISGLSSAVAASEASRHAAMGASESAASRLESAMQELEAFGPLIGNLRTELEQTRAELTYTQERCDKLQTEVDKADQATAAAAAGAGGEETGIAEWQKKYRELRGKFEVEIDYRTKLKEANLRLKAKLQTQEEKELWRQVERVNEVLRQKDEAHNKLMSVHLQLQQQLRQYREREEAVSQRSVTIEATIGRMHAEISTLHAQLQTWENSDKEKDHEMQVVRVQKENLVRQLSASQQSNSQLENTLAKMKTVVTELEQELREAMAKNAELNRQNQRLSRRTTVDVPPDMLQLQLAELRTMVKCSLCNDNFKDVMLTKCAHCFCRSCVNNNLLTARNRKCPLCGIRFAESDVKPVHLTQ